MASPFSHLPGTIHLGGDAPTLLDDLSAAIEAEAIHAVNERGVCHLALSGGSVEKLCMNLVADPRYRGFPWEDTHVWQVDERRVGDDDDRRNWKMLTELLLAHVVIPEDHLHPMPVLEDDPAGAYERDLAEAFGVPPGGPPLPDARLDYVLLGMGGDWHTASLFPHSTALDVTDRWVAVNDGPQVTPPDRVTLTYPLLNAARRVGVLLLGDGKAEPLRKLDAAIADGSASVETMPITGIQPAGDDARLTWFIDPAAARGD